MVMLCPVPGIFKKFLLLHSQAILELFLRGSLCSLSAPVMSYKKTLPQCFKKTNNEQIS